MAAKIDERQEIRGDLKGIVKREEERGDIRQVQDATGEFMLNINKGSMDMRLDSPMPGLVDEMRNQMQSPPLENQLNITNDIMNFAIDLG